MTTRHHTNAGRRVASAACVAAAVTALVPVQASAQTATDDTRATVVVNSAISLTGLTESFTLTGLPGATVSGDAVATYTVETNNLAGYVVTVQSRTATLDPTDAGNTDTIPIGALSVRETGTTDYTPLSETVPVTVHRQTTRSAEGGDDLSTDYQVVIPFVNEDTYTAVLDYVATTL